MTTKKNCPATDNEFIQTHGGQKYADGKSRNKFHNDIARKERHRRSPIIKALDLNYKILKRILGDENTTECSRDFLLGGGFSFEHLTTLTIEKGKPIYSVFGISYREFEVDKFIITQL